MSISGSDCLEVWNIRPIQALVLGAFYKKKKVLVSLPRQYGGKTELGCRIMRDLLGRPFDKSALFLAKDKPSAKKATKEKFSRLFDPVNFEVNTEHIYSRKRAQSIAYIASVDKDPDRMRGGTYSYVHWSEVAFSKIEKGESITDVFQKIVAPTLKMKDGYAYLESTNNGKNGWYDLWESARDFGFARILHGLGDLVEMNLVDRSEYDQIKKETLPLIFRQEYECEWVTFAGAVYDEFDPKIHVSKDVQGPRSHQDVGFGIDWGYDPSATCVLFAYKEDGVIHIYDEIYAKEQRTDTTKREMMIRFNAFRVKNWRGVADHEQDRIDELNREGIPCGKADKSNVLGARMEIKILLFEGRLVIHPRCEFLIKDLSSMYWDKKKDGVVNDKLCSWGHYDAEAALRYLVRLMRHWDENEEIIIPKTNNQSIRESMIIKGTR